MSVYRRRRVPIFVVVRFVDQFARGDGVSRTVPVVSGLAGFVRRNDVSEGNTFRRGRGRIDRPKVPDGGAGFTANTRFEYCAPSDTDAERPSPVAAVSRIALRTPWSCDWTSRL